MRLFDGNGSETNYRVEWKQTVYNNLRGNMGVRVDGHLIIVVAAGCYYRRWLLLAFGISMSCSHISSSSSSSSTSAFGVEAVDESEVSVRIRS